jgi:hypothetical protein
MDEDLDRLMFDGDEHEEECIDGIVDDEYDADCQVDPDDELSNGGAIDDDYFDSSLVDAENRLIIPQTEDGAHEVCYNT